MPRRRDQYEVLCLRTDEQIVLAAGNPALRGAPAICSGATT
jgi:hypothetical protein